ncbi:hypothetical protein GCM10023208_20990 [Erythrobacter westpacificensis]|uniref:TonB-dependent receptor plug domain-containing protein n=1 Tax=Erythrobacter westpacificensis TaxID=1055231 RepID=A0ABP9KFP3_9SPHN
MRVKFALLGGAAISAVTVQAHAQGVVPQDDSSGEAIIVLGDRLEESVPEELEEYGSRLEIVDGRLIDEAGYVDASQALQSLVPGLYVAPKNGAFDYVNVSLAGSRSSEVLFLVDGVRISNRLYAGTTPLDTIPAHMIERIEVLKGPQALFYGTQAVGGVIRRDSISTTWPLRPASGTTVPATARTRPCGTCQVAMTMTAASSAAHS